MDARLADGHANRLRADAPCRQVPLLGAVREPGQIQPAEANRLTIQHVGLRARGVGIVALRGAGRVPRHVVLQPVFDKELVVGPFVTDLVGDEPGAVQRQRHGLLLLDLVLVTVTVRDLDLDILALPIFLGRPASARRTDGGQR
jgi:hypothetical protein